MVVAHCDSSSSLAELFPQLESEEEDWREWGWMLDAFPAADPVALPMGWAALPGDEKSEEERPRTRAWIKERRRREQQRERKAPKRHHAASAAGEAKVVDPNSISLGGDSIDWTNVMDVAMEEINGDEREQQMMRRAAVKQEKADDSDGGKSPSKRRRVASQHFDPSDDQLGGGGAWQPAKKEEKDETPKETPKRGRPSKKVIEARLAAEAAAAAAARAAEAAEQAAKEEEEEYEEDDENDVDEMEEMMDHLRQEMDGTVEDEEEEEDEEGEDEEQEDEEQDAEEEGEKQPGPDHQAAEPALDAGAAIDPNAPHCICQQPYNPKKFYVGCDVCYRWFHGKCVGISEKKSKKINGWQCEECIRARNRAEQSGEELYCLCQTPYDDTQFYVGCDGCEGWFHPRCVGITQEAAEAAAEYLCPRCTEQKMQRRREREHRPSTSGHGYESGEPLLSRADYPLIWSLLESLTDHPMSKPFREPVDTVKYPDYTQVVINPVDLSSISIKLSGLEYQRLKDLTADVSQMFENARLYHPRDSSVWQCVEALESVFRTRLAEVRVQMEHQRGGGLRRASECRTVDSSLDIDTDQLIEACVDPAMFDQLL